MMNTKHYKSHFIFQSSLSFDAGVGKLKFGNRHLNNNIPTFNVDQLLAYQFNPYVTFGVDLGVNIWKKTAFIPVALSLNIDFMDYVVSPCWYLNAGYSFKWYSSPKPEKMTLVIHGADPGWYINSGVGAKLRLKDELMLLFAVDYKMQYSAIRYSEIPLDGTDYHAQLYTNRSKNLFYHFVGVKIGLLYW
ncbi:MAG: hypothetical protein J5644_00710 [Bacteroidales bacterium]|nr:hypothetical protein [Bacteroidales bacterium]